MSDAKVWREGRRIRCENGMGYNDLVTDDMIWEHIATSVDNRDLTHIEFATAVLRLRENERRGEGMTTLPRARGQPAGAVPSHPHRPEGP